MKRFKKKLKTLKINFMKKNGNKNVSMLTLFGVFVFGLVLFFNMRSISDSSYDNSDVTLDEVEKNVVAAKSAEMD